MRKKNKNPNLEIEEIFQQLQQHDYISFDIFDTLICRNTLKPTDIFYYIEAEIYKKYKEHYNFAACRSFYENILKAKMKKEHDYDDINIHEIYDYMLLNNVFPSKEICEEVKRIEVDTEKTYIIPREIGQILYKKAIENNKKIIFISDMYLTEDYIKEILQQTGYDKYDKLYLSSFLRLSKNTGRIYPYILKDLKTTSEKILHIGDNPKGDIKRAHNYNIKTVYVPSAYSLLENDPIFMKYGKFKNLTLSQRSFLGFYMNKKYALSKVSGYQKNSIEYEQYYQILGIGVFSFALWLIEKAKQDNIKHLYLLKSDSKMIVKAFEVISKYQKLNFTYSEEYTNRNFFLYYFFENINYSIEAGFDIFFKLTISELLDLLDLDNKEKQEVITNLKANNIDDLNHVLSLANSPYFLENKKILEVIFKSNPLINRKKAIKAYIEQEAFKENPETSACVDISYKHTSFYVLNMFNKVKKGYSFIENGIARVPSGSVDSYLSGEIYEPGKTEKYTNFFIEAGFSYLDESVSYINFNNSTNKYEVVKINKGLGKTDIKNLENYLKGVGDFIEEYAAYKYNVNSQINLSSGFIEFFIKEALKQCNFAIVFQNVYQTTTMPNSYSRAGSASKITYYLENLEKIYKMKQRSKFTSEVVRYCKRGLEKANQRNNQKSFLNTVSKIHYALIYVLLISVL